MASPQRAAADASPTTVAIIVWLVAAVLLSAGALSTGQLLRDTDDLMRAVQVRDWLEGAGWFDLRQERLNPPFGGDIHWSRLPDLPLAALILLGRPLLGDAMALTAAAVTVPLILLLGLFLAVGWVVRPLVGRDGEPAAMLVLAFTVTVLLQFAPGRIDHHNWQLLTAAVGLGACLRVMLDPSRSKAAALAGIAFGAGLWVGMESMPWVVAFTAALVLRWLCRGEAAVARAGAAFALALLGTCTVLLPVAYLPEQYFAVACDAFSAATIVVSAVLVCFWATLGFATRKLEHMPGRFAALLGISAVSIGILAVLLPECRGGPLGGVDPLLARVWLARVREAQPLHALFAASPEQVPVVIALPVLGLMIALWGVIRGKGAAVWIWWGVLIHLALAVALTGWQVRVSTFANLYAIPPIAWLVHRAWQRAEDRWSGWRQVVIRTAVLLALVPLPWLGFLAKPAAGTPASGAASEAEERDCDLRSLSWFAARPDGSASIIAAPIDLGPQILFETPHRVLAAPYHRNTRGNLDVYHLFTTESEAEAQAVVDRRAIDFVLLCRGIPEVDTYAGTDGRAFINRLTGGNAPDWLRPVPLPDEPRAILYAVVR